MGSQNTYPATDSYSRVLQQSPATESCNRALENEDLIIFTTIAFLMQLSTTHFACGTWLVHMWDMSHASELTQFGTWLIHIWDMMHSHVGHDTFASQTWSITRGTWLIHSTPIPSYPYARTCPRSPPFKKKNNSKVSSTVNFLSTLSSK